MKTNTHLQDIDQQIKNCYRAIKFSKVFIAISLALIAMGFAISNPGLVIFNAVVGLFHLGCIALQENCLKDLYKNRELLIGLEKYE